MLRFLFKLRDIDKIEPSGEPGNQSLSWFGLTDGAYCIETSAGRLLEHTGTIDPSLGQPWCEYQVVRLFEDLITIWPKVYEAVPADICDRYFPWRNNERQWVKRAEDVEFLRSGKRQTGGSRSVSSIFRICRRNPRSISGVSGRMFS